MEKIKFIELVEVHNGLRFDGGNKITYFTIQKVLQECFEHFELSADFSNMKVISGNLFNRTKDKALVFYNSEHNIKIVTILFCSKECSSLHIYMDGESYKICHDNLLEKPWWTEAWQTKNSDKLIPEHLHRMLLDKYTVYRIKDEKLRRYLLTITDIFESLEIIINKNVENIKEYLKNSYP